jgi:hypothetical protein
VVGTLTTILNLTIYVYIKHTPYNYIKVLPHIDYYIYNTTSRNLNTMLNVYTKI